MKRLLVLLAATAVAASPVVAEAAPKKPPVKKKTTRTVVWSYSGIAGPSIEGLGARLCTASGMDNCFDVQTQKHETKVTFAVKDASGQKVALQYALDDDYAGTATNVCAKGEILVSKGSLVTANTTFDPTCGAPATQGTVTFTITGLK